LQGMIIRDFAGYDYTRFCRVWLYEILQGMIIRDFARYDYTRFCKVWLYEISSFHRGLVEGRHCSGYHLFRTMYRNHLQGPKSLAVHSSWVLEDGTDVSFQPSVTNHQHTSGTVPDKQRSGYNYCVTSSAPWAWNEGVRRGVNWFVVRWGEVRWGEVVFYVCCKSFLAARNTVPWEKQKFKNHRCNYTVQFKGKR
jgi:hypothetical protein